MEELMEFQCPACGAALRAPHMAAGRPGRCTKCQKEFIVPAQFAMDSGPAGPAPAPSAAPTQTPMINPFERPAAKPQPKPGLGDTLRPLLPGAIAVGLLAAGGWYAWSFFTSGDEEGKAARGREAETSAEDVARRAAEQAEHARTEAAAKAAQALALQEKARREAAAAAASAAAASAASAAAAARAAAVAARPPAAPAPRAAPPAVTMSRKEADQLVAGGKLAMLDAATDPSRALVAAVAFAKAVPYYEATGDVDQVCDLEANIFWCKRHMTGESVKVLRAEGRGQGLFKQAIDRVDELAAKDIPKSEAKSYYDRADKFAQRAPRRPGADLGALFRGRRALRRHRPLAAGAEGQPAGAISGNRSASRPSPRPSARPSSPRAARRGRHAALHRPRRRPTRAGVATVRKLYKDDYVKSRPNQQRRLIAKLLEQVPMTRDDPNTQYALLSETIELSISVADWYSIFNACDLMSQYFTGVEPKAKKKEIYGKARANPTVQSILKLLDNPDDADANSVVGKYFCFDSNKWDIGLPLLAHGSDAEFKAAAEMELLRPAGAPQQAELADKWYDLGKKARMGQREGMLARAFSWYKQAEPGITGITKQRIGTRIEEIDGLLPMTNLDYDNLTPQAVGPPAAARWSRSWRARTATTPASASPMASACASSRTPPTPGPATTSARRSPATGRATTTRASARASSASATSRSAPWSCRSSRASCRSPASSRAMAASSADPTPPAGARAAPASSAARSSRSPTTTSAPGGLEAPDGEAMAGELAAREAALDVEEGRPRPGLARQQGEVELLENAVRDRGDDRRAGSRPGKVLQRDAVVAAGSPASATGSTTTGAAAKRRSSAMMSITRELRTSAQFSLKARPRMSTVAPFTGRPCWIIRRTHSWAIHWPMPSLMRRPARMTCGM